MGDSSGSVTSIYGPCEYKTPNGFEPLTTHLGFSNVSAGLYNSAGFNSDYKEDRKSVV